MKNYIKQEDKYIEIKDYDEAFENFKKNLDFLREKDKEEISMLQKKISELEEAAFNKKETKKLKQQIRLLKEQIDYGFPISLEESMNISEWQKSHIKEKNCMKQNDDNIPFHYEFIPSKNGTKGICKCSICNEKYVFKNA